MNKRLDLTQSKLGLGIFGGTIELDEKMDVIYFFFSFPDLSKDILEK